MRILSLSKARRALIPVYIANLFFSFHYNILVYINSSYLERFFSPTLVSFLYVLGAIGTIILFSFSLKQENKYGNRKFFSSFLFLELIAVAGLALASSPLVLALFFILFQATFLMIVFSLDIFLEDATQEKETGRVRGIYLTLGNLALTLSPLMIAIAAPQGEFNHLYILSAFLLLPLFLLGAFSFKGFKDSPRTATRLPWRTWWKSHNVRSVTEIRLTLDMFYSFMVIFLPIYLHEHIGFAWTEISIIFTIMLLPFVLFEIPAGKLADEWCGEKELMTLGLFIIGSCLIALPFMHTHMIAYWAILLFLSRTGASLVEVTAESYFFKHVDKRDTGLISMYRLSWPAAFIIGPLLGGLSLLVFPFEAMFLLVAFIVLKSMEISASLQDTR
jgi:MFS family permease